MFDIDSPLEYQKHRTIEFRWPIAELAPNKTLYAVLRVYHRKPGVNYFHGVVHTEGSYNATLSNVTVEQLANATAESFGLFKGAALESIPAGTRYSAKKLRDYAPQALARLQDRFRANDPEILPYFSRQVP